ncbi:alpha-amylase family glycosyl hydrolase [Pseudoxanthomonas indica]|uniref:Cyclomaltodextrin glucanotransferase n=1 Tax=Pseudoxanthomonas indica TaxID=428993 RepID=A0A1T5LWI6_9GAMM|nr:alpha-amylase family glycosyl hydrolase [Pseudoxanthomonas indica]GGD40198.1 cyclomaltodextrin glucanotransferase [Pseudoxanthomonas indica]SKC79939.1 cyclomaltodextrin glucanotransferase [Pseudoxanthomonas indica]
MRQSSLLAVAVTLVLAGGATCKAHAGDWYGTTEPFARESVYFLLTDRFVNGDPGNDHRDQGGAQHSFDRPTPGAPAGQSDNVGYLGGDFKGVLDNARYIRDMGFTSVWVTPIVDNPDEAFTGGEPVAWNGAFTDRGKTGYHGYWGINFYKLDEHLPSAGLDFAGFTAGMKQQQLDVVLDIVANHGSPAYTMPAAQAQYGKLWDAQGKLVADHQNLPPAQLDPEHKPLHAFYNRNGGLAQLSDFNERNPQVLDYLVGAYEQWIDQGASAFRVDTIAWMPHDFWKAFADRIRAKRPGFFMFGENFNYDAASIAAHTWPRNGGYSLLDFPLKARLVEVFEKPDSDFGQLAPALYLEDGPYANPYELMTFYDNHDMARMKASDNGFIDAHNWLFTARGIPVIYYGSETGFMRGTAEHAGNRNYFGQERIAQAPRSPIFAPLQAIARLRRDSVALQRGLQLNVELKGNEAAFYRVYDHDGQRQTALVLLNKGDHPTRMRVSDYLESGIWRDAFTGKTQRVRRQMQADVPAHGVRVYFFDGELRRKDTLQRLQSLMQRKSPFNE